MTEILPDIYHWTALHDRVGIEVSSYWFAGRGVLLDPLVPPEGMGAFDNRPPEHVLLTNGQHYRDAGAFVERFGCDVRCSRAAADELDPELGVVGFDDGDVLPGGFEAIAIGLPNPDETAFYLSDEGGIVVVADCVVRRGDGPLCFVPDPLLGDDPDEVKRGLRAALVELCRSRGFRHLLPAHGSPVIGDANAVLRRFVR